MRLLLILALRSGWVGGDVCVGMFGGLSACVLTLKFDTALFSNYRSCLGISSSLTTRVAVRRIFGGADCTHQFRHCVCANVPSISGVVVADTCTSLANLSGP